MLSSRGTPCSLASPSTKTFHYPHTTNSTTPTPTSNLPASIQPWVSTNPTPSQYHSHQYPGTYSNPNLMFISTAVLSGYTLCFGNADASESHHNMFAEPFISVVEEQGWHCSPWHCWHLSSRK